MKKPRRRRDVITKQTRIHRSLSIVPSLFTIGNIFCGYYSIISTLHGKWDQAAVLIGIGYILDGLDGRIARLTKTASDFGVQLDSHRRCHYVRRCAGNSGLQLGFRREEQVPKPGSRNMTISGSWRTFAFVVCGALRLARFQRSNEETSGEQLQTLFRRAADSCRRGNDCGGRALLQDA